jgi:hypothetical protein
MHTKFHEGWCGHSGSIKLITSTIWEAAVLVLLMGIINDVCRWVELRWHDTYVPRTFGSAVQVILRVLPQQFERLWYWYYWWEGFLKYTTEMTSRGMIYLPVLMLICWGIRVILRLLPKQFERLWCWFYCWGVFMMCALKWPQMEWCIHTMFCEVWYRRSSNIKVLLQQFDCHVGIMNGRDLWSILFRWTHVTWYT